MTKIDGVYTDSVYVKTPPKSHAPPENFINQWSGVRLSKLRSVEDLGPS